MSNRIHHNRSLAVGAAALGLLLLSSACQRPSVVANQGQAPREAVPGQLAVDKVPLFVCFGTDDNGYSGMEGSGAGGGLHYFTEIFGKEKNPAGTGQAKTFDGAPAHYSFYVNTIMMDPPKDKPAIYGGGYAWDNPVCVKRAWQEALEQGHEIGAHTHSHPHGAKFSVDQWDMEMQQCLQFLGRPRDASESLDRPDPNSGLGLKASEVLGFRTPYLEYNDHTLTAAAKNGFVYDCSMEESPISSDGRNYVWPRKLDTAGIASHSKRVSPHPDLWEIPVYSFIVPPDDQCARYGVPVGFRTRMKQVEDSFDVESGEVTGMDWNLWLEFYMTPAEFLATLKYTFDQHLAGNRAPMTVGLHAHLYTEKYVRKEFKSTVAERQNALKEFLHYVLQHPQARVVSCRELLTWMNQPTPLS